MNSKIRNQTDAGVRLLSRNIESWFQTELTVKGSNIYHFYAMLCVVVNPNQGHTCDDSWLSNRSLECSAILFTGFSVFSTIHLYILSLQHSTAETAVVLALFCHCEKTSFGQVMTVNSKTCRQKQEKVKRDKQHYGADNSRHLISILDNLLS